MRLSQQEYSWSLFIVVRVVETWRKKMPTEWHDNLTRASNVFRHYNVQQHRWGKCNFRLTLWHMLPFISTKNVPHIQKQAYSQYNHIYSMEHSVIFSAVNVQRMEKSVCFWCFWQTYFPRSLINVAIMASTIYNVEKQQNVRGKSAGEMKVEKGKMADIKRHTKEKIDGMRRTKR